MAFFTQLEQKILQCVWEQKTPNRQSNLEKVKQEPTESGTLTADYSASFSNQNTVLAQKQKHIEWSMEQEESPERNLLTCGQLI